MNMTDTGTGYFELFLVTDRSMKTVIQAIESSWVCKHGAPLAISADDEYNRRLFHNYLVSHGIQFQPRPARRHNKLGIVERKNSTIKAIVSKLDDERSDAWTETLVSSASFQSNMFSGNKLLSSFELARGYWPSILGIPKTVATEELLKAHREQVAIRTIQRLLNSNAPTVTYKDMFNSGDPVWIHYRSSKNNEPVEWIRGTVDHAEDHILVARRSNRGPPMRVAYEDVRFAPRGALTAELLECSLETELCRSDRPTPEDSLKYIGHAHNNATISNNASDVLKTTDFAGAIMIQDELPPSTPSIVPDNNFESSTDRTLAECSGRDDDEAKNRTLLAVASNCHDGGKRHIGVYAKDIGETGNMAKKSMNIHRDNSRELEEIQNVIRAKQVTASHLTFAPPWILQDALATEHQSNWSDAYVEV